jgi:hypothetical protein
VGQLTPPSSPDFPFSKYSTFSKRCDSRGREIGNSTHQKARPGAGKSIRAVKEEALKKATEAITDLIALGLDY